MKRKGVYYRNYGGKITKTNPFTVIEGQSEEEVPSFILVDEDEEGDVDRNLASIVFCFLLKNIKVIRYFILIFLLAPRLELAPPLNERLL